MSRVLCFALLVIIALQEVSATSPEVCQVRAGPESCRVNTAYFIRNIRFEYRWDERKCAAFDWDGNCPEPVGENNFVDYVTCERECSGWA